MDGLFLTRLGFIVLCTGALAWISVRFEHVARALRAFFFEPTPPINLGILRVFTFAILIIDTTTAHSELYAALPPEYSSLPQGWSWFGEFLPITPASVAWAQRGLYVSAALATIGLFTRPAMAVAALLAVYVLGVPNFFFKIGHGSHVQVLAALVLAASPAGDALAADALLRRRRGQAAPLPDAAYTLPVRFCWLLLGSTYLFPGLWKLWDGGDLWITGIKLEVELYKKWATMPEFFPPFRLDRHPALLAVLGTFTLVLEIGFFFAMFRRTTRVVAAFAAVCFHVGIGVHMNIWFNPIYPLIALLDWPDIVPARLATRAPPFLSRRMPVLHRAVTASDPGTRLPRSLGASFVVGCVLLFGMFVVGFSPVDSWPIAVYPRFSSRSSKAPEMAFALQYKIVSPHGKVRDLRSPLGELGDSVTYRITRELLQRPRQGKPNKMQRYLDLMAHLVRNSGEPIEPGSSLFVYRYDFPIDPELRRDFEPELELVAEAEL